MLCGISPSFPGLFPTRGQIAHVLLTRAPLYRAPEGAFLVRLACVRHAASVRSEPGSNSPVEAPALAGLHFRTLIRLRVQLTAKERLRTYARTIQFSKSSF